MSAKNNIDTYPYRNQGRSQEKEKRDLKFLINLMVLTSLLITLYSVYIYFNPIK